MAQKSSELEQYLQRVRELEDMYHRLEEALEDERQAKHDEEAMRKLQARSRKHVHTHVLHGMWIHTGSKSGDVSSPFEPM